MKRFLLHATLCILVSKAFAQDEIPVDMYTGKPSITIPIWIISSGDISEPIALSYSADAVQQESTFGVGWNLQAAGSITREVRTFPDDVGYGATTQGWLYNNSAGVSIASDVGAFTPAADTLAGAREAGEGTDYAKLNGFSYLVDTEPDIFRYNFGGISGSFVIDNGLVIRTMPYQDIKIVMNYLNASDKRITGFTITTNTGHVYTFDYKISVTKTTNESMYANRNFYIPTEYELYNPSVTYTREWKLTRVESPEGAYITFGYTSLGSDTNIRDVDFGFYQNPDQNYSDPTDMFVRTVYHVTEVTGKANLTNISSSTGSKIDFVYNGTLQSITISDDRRGSTTAERYIKSFSFVYQPVIYSYSTNGLNPEKTWLFLMSMMQYSGCEKISPYKFTYAGVRYLDSNFPPGYYLPAAEAGVDLWGYPNGVAYNKHLFPKLYIYPGEPASERYRIDPIPGYTGQQVILEGANRHSSAGGMLSGTLESITSPEGGVTSFDFEGNQYLDTRTNLNAFAGGLRIKSISYFDGVNPIPVKKSFEYKDPATGLSSGRLIRKPVLAIPAYKWKSSSGSAYDKIYETSGLTADEKWKYLTIRTTADQTPSETTHGNIVGYKIVTVKRPGAGYARYEYHVPAIHGQGTSGAWKATDNKFARYSATPTMGIIEQQGGGTWMFPYSPNPDFDYERGLVWKNSDFNESGVLVRKVETTYQYLYKTGSQPTKVWGLKYDRFPGCDNDNKIFFYGKYFLLTEVQKVPLVETITTYDVADITGATFQTENIEYTYQNINSLLIKEMKRTGSDGNVYATQFKYPNDYTFTTTGAAEAVMIGSLKTAYRHGVPIEEIQTLKKGSDPIRVVGGKVIKLDPMGLNRPLIRSMWKLKVNPTIRIDSFQTSAVVNASGYKFKIDPRYERTDSILSYLPTGVVKANRNPFSRQTNVTGFGYNNTLPVVQLINAADGQAAFSDFENTTGFEFSSATPYYGTGRTGAKGFYPWVMLSKTITKPSVNNYILSFWVKTNAPLTFNVYLKNTAGSPTYYSTTVSVPSTGSEYQFVQKLIPITAVSVSSFKIEIQASGLAAPPTGNPSPGGTSASLLPVVDDIFFYPESAEMIATTYNIPFGAASVTTGTGATTYNEYDKLGRLRFVYDKNRNIVKRNVYQYNQETPLVADFSIPNQSTAIVGTSTTFTAATNDCVTDATYEWNWGSGYVSGPASQVNTFTTTGTYPVSLRVTSPTYGVKTVTKNIIVIDAPFIVSICATGIIRRSAEGNVSVTCDAITNTAPPNWIIFQASQTGTDTYSYQWKVRDFGASTWVNVGSNTNQYIVKPTTSFEVKCDVTSSQGLTVSSLPMEVVFE